MLACPSRRCILVGGRPACWDRRTCGDSSRDSRRVFDLSALAEATIEVNPESASEDLLRSAMDLGFARVSVGVQSLSDHELRSVGRVHTAAQAVEAVSRVVGMGFKDVSADVIVGLPGQTLGGAQEKSIPQTQNPESPKSQIVAGRLRTGLQERLHRRVPRGVQRGEAPLPRVWGCPPIPNLPPRLGAQGVERRFRHRLGRITDTHA